MRGKRQAKLASRDKRSNNTGESKRPVMVSHGCRVSRNVTSRTDCGQLMRPGWDFGTDADVTCTRPGCTSLTGQEDA